MEDNPEAKLHLKLARDQLEKAEKFRKEGEEEKAEIELLKAQADADYALALLRRDAAREEAEEVQEKVRKLREEMTAGEES